MGVAAGRLAVGGPAGVADADLPAHGIGFQHLYQPRQLAHLAPHADGAIGMHHRQTGRVVAAILQPFQAFENDGGRVPRPHVTDDSTHVMLLWWRTAVNSRRWAIPKRTTQHRPFGLAQDKLFRPVRS